jgi:hypothetical protein
MRVSSLTEVPGTGRERVSPQGVGRDTAYAGARRVPLGNELEGLQVTTTFGALGECPRPMSRRAANRDASDEWDSSRYPY